MLIIHVYFINHLKKSKNQYKRLLGLLPVGIVVHKGDKITYVNDAVLKLTDIQSAEDMVGESIWGFVPTKFKEEIISRINSLLENEEVGFVEEQIIKKDGTVVDVEIGGMFLGSKNEPEILVVLKDITERKKSEQLVKNIENEKMKTEFFANLSHELKTPLNLIFSTVQLMEWDEKEFGAKINFKKRTGTLKQNSYRLLRLVNNLIDITKSDAGYLVLNTQNHNIYELVENIVRSIEDYTKQKNIKLIFEKDMDEKIISCDPDKIERILLNLLSNAIKFSKKGGKIIVKMKELEDSVQIIVQDNGIGIPKEKQQTVFERFFQIDKSLKRNHEGSGIGLSIVKSLVEMHGGKISLFSQEEIGSKFLIQLPSKLIEKNDTAVEIEYKEDLVEKINIEFSDIY